MAGSSHCTFVEQVLGELGISQNHQRQINLESRPLHKLICFGRVEIDIVLKLIYCICNLGLSHSSVQVRYVQRSHVLRKFQGAKVVQ